MTWENLLMAVLNEKIAKKSPKSDTNVKHDFQIKDEHNVSYMYMYMCRDNRAKKHTVNKMYK